MAILDSFNLLTSLRYDPILLRSAENQELAFTSPCPFYMLQYHRDRVVEAASYFDFDAIQTALKDGSSYQTFLLEHVRAYQQGKNLDDGPLKVRVVFNRAGDIKVELSPVPPEKLDLLFPQTLELSDDVTTEKPFTPSPLTGGALHMGPDDHKISDVPGKVASSIRPSFDIVIDAETTNTTPHAIWKTTHRVNYDTARDRALASANANFRFENKEVLLCNPAGMVMDASFTTPYFFRNGRWVTPPTDEEHGGQRGTSRRWALKNGLAAEDYVPKQSIGTGEKVWLSNGVRGFAWGVVTGA